MRNLTVEVKDSNVSRTIDLKATIDERGLWDGSKITIERRISGRQQDRRYNAARWIRSIRKGYDNLLDIAEGR